MSSDRPAVLGTAGHVDHGKTALVAALTGVDTDRLEEERRRGISIELGYAPLELPGGLRLSVVDVPGHERLVRTMVAGATGIDLYLLCVAADDGVMPQTREHAAVLAALGVRTGVVAVTKADAADPARAGKEARALLGGDVAVVAVSARTGAGLDALRDALAGAARAAGAGMEADDERSAAPAVLHVDRAFTIAGAGTVVTGTLWRGSIGAGDELLLLGAEAGPERRARVRVRGVQVHDEPRERAGPGQRVAVNLRDAGRDDVARGDVLCAPAARLRPAHILDVALDTRVEHGTRVHVHHGTREAPARVAWLGGPYHQLRCERALVAAAGDRVVIRSIAPPDTLGGGVVLDPAARRHGPGSALLARLTALERGEQPPSEEPVPASVPAARTPAATPPPLDAAAQALEARLRAAGHEPLALADLDASEREGLAALRTRQRVVRIGRDLQLHADVLDELADRVTMLIEAEGEITLARLRDELGTTRRYAQALLEALDAARVTKRVGDTRVLRRARP